MTKSCFIAYTQNGAFRVQSPGGLESTLHSQQSHLPQQLGDDLDLLPPGEQVGEGHPRHPGHLHVVDHTHQLLQQAEGQVGVLQAVDGQTAARLLVPVLQAAGEKTNRTRRVDAA